MPTERFLNLPQEKRQRILSAAMEEFTRVPYDEVSINRIICGAHIPRGSFYQYFEGKKDLLDFIMQGYGEGLRKLMDDGLASTGGDLFAVFTDVLDYTLVLGMDEKERAFISNIISGARLCDVETFAFSQVTTAQLLQMYRDKIDFTSFYRDDEDYLTEVVGMLAMLLGHTVARVFAAGAQPEQIQQSFRCRLEIIKQGVIKKGGEG